MDGITISTAAISAILGSGGVSALATWLVNRRGASRCERCPDHKQHDQRIVELEKGLVRIDTKLDLLLDSHRQHGA